MKTLNIGIVGAGNRAGGLGRNLRSLPGVRITALADPDENRLNNLANDFDVPPEGRFTDSKKLLASPEVEAVVITTPDHTHHPLVMEAARQKKHIFCEKPMALNLRHCVEMEKSAQRNNVLFMMGFCLRYNNLYRKAKELIAKGGIGRLRLAYAVDSVERGSAYFFHSWHRLKKHSGGLLLQKATHSLDIINWMVESRPVSVYALGGLDVFGGKESNKKTCDRCGRRKTCPEFIDVKVYHSDYLSGKSFVVEDKCVFAREIDILDNEILTIRYASGVRATFVECNFTPDYKREFAFIGDEGRLAIYDDYSHNGAIHPVRHRQEIVFARRHGKRIVTLRPKMRPGGHGGGDPAMIEEFVDALRGKRTPLATGMTGVLSTAIAAAAEKSIATGKVEPIHIKNIKNTRK